MNTTRLLSRLVFLFSAVSNVLCSTIIPNYTSDGSATEGYEKVLEVMNKLISENEADVHEDCRKDFYGNGTFKTIFPDFINDTNEALWTKIYLLFAQQLHETITQNQNVEKWKNFIEKQILRFITAIDELVEKKNELLGNDGKRKLVELYEKATLTLIEARNDPNFLTQVIGEGKLVTTDVNEKEKSENAEMEIDNFSISDVRNQSNETTTKSDGNEPIDMDVDPRFTLIKKDLADEGYANICQGDIDLYLSHKEYLIKGDEFVSILKALNESEQNVRPNDIMYFESFLKNSKDIVIDKNTKMETIISHFINGSNERLWKCVYLLFAQELHKLMVQNWNEGKSEEFIAESISRFVTAMNELVERKVELLRSDDGKDNLIGIYQKATLNHACVRENGDIDLFVSGKKQDPNELNSLIYQLNNELENGKHELFDNIQKTKENPVISASTGEELAVESNGIITTCNEDNFSEYDEEIRKYFETTQENIFFIDNIEEYLKNNPETNQKVIEIFNQDPNFGNWHKSETIAKEVYDLFDPILAAQRNNSSYNTSNQNINDDDTLNQSDDASIENHTITTGTKGKEEIEGNSEENLVIDSGDEDSNENGSVISNLTSDSSEGEEQLDEHEEKNDDSNSLCFSKNNSVASNANILNPITNDDDNDSTNDDDNDSGNDDDNDSRNDDDNDNVSNVTNSTNVTNVDTKSTTNNDAVNKNISDNDGDDDDDNDDDDVTINTGLNTTTNPSTNNTNVITTSNTIGSDTPINAVLNPNDNVVVNTTINDNGNTVQNVFIASNVTTDPDVITNDASDIFSEEEDDTSSSSNSTCSSSDSTDSISNSSSSSSSSKNTSSCSNSMNTTSNNTDSSSDSTDSNSNTTSSSSSNSSSSNSSNSSSGSTSVSNDDNKGIYTGGGGGGYKTYIDPDLTPNEATSEPGDTASKQDTIETTSNTTTTVPNKTKVDDKKDEKKEKDGKKDEKKDEKKDKDDKKDKIKNDKKDKDDKNDKKEKDKIKNDKKEKDDDKKDKKIDKKTVNTKDKSYKQGTSEISGGKGGDAIKMKSSKVDDNDLLASTRNTADLIFYVNLVLLSSVVIGMSWMIYSHWSLLTDATTIPDKYKYLEDI